MNIDNGLPPRTADSTTTSSSSASKLKRQLEKETFARWQRQLESSGVLGGANRGQGQSEDPLDRDKRAAHTRPETNESAGRPPTRSRRYSDSADVRNRGVPPVDGGEGLRSTVTGGEGALSTVTGDTVARDRALLRQEREAFEKEKAALQREREEMDQERAVLVADKDELRKHAAAISSSRDAHRAMEKKADALRKQIEELDADHSNAVAAAQEVMTSVEGQIQDTLAEIDALNERLATLQGGLANLQGNRDAITAREHERQEEYIYTRGCLGTVLQELESLLRKVDR